MYAVIESCYFVRAEVSSYPNGSWSSWL